MTKSELINKLAQKNPQLYVRDVEGIVDTILSEMSDALVNGDRIELRGFGAFSVKERAARIGRNPRTGESVEVAAKKLPAFKAGNSWPTRKELKSTKKKLTEAEKDIEDLSDTVHDQQIEQLEKPE